MRRRLAFIALLAALCATVQIGSPAQAADLFSLTIATDGTGAGTVECEVDEGPAEPCASQYPEGTDLVLVPSPASGSEFTEFTGDCGPSECELTMTEAKSVTATFDLLPQFALTLKTSGNGSGTVKCVVGMGPAETCKATYPEGTELTLVPEAAPNSEFIRFAGDCEEETCELTMDEAHSVTTVFSLIPMPPEYSFTLKLKGTGSGTVLCEAQEGPEPCKAKYPEETELLLHPSAAAGSEFAGFSGACSGFTCEVTMDAAKTVTAAFNLIPRTLSVTKAGTGAGTVQCKFNGGSAGACTSPQPNGASVEIIATPSASSTFAGFGGGTGSASSCSTSPCSFTITANSSVTATFNLKPTEFALDVNNAGTGSGTVKCKAGAGSPEPCATEYPEGTALTLIAEAGAGSEFAGFSGACTGSSCALTMNAAKTVTATFDLIPPPFEYPLAVERLGTGSGTVTSDPAGIDCGPDCSESLPEGTKVTLTATPAPGSVFDHWTGGGCTGSGTCTTTMSTSRTAKAVFTAVGQRTLTVSRVGTGRGTVTSSPTGIDCGGACEAGFGVGTKVTLTATAAAGSRFAGFSGACTGTGSCRVTMDEAREVTVAFQRVPNGVARAAARAKVKAGKALLRISCPGEGACKGKLKLLARVGPGGKRATIGTASFSVAPDASRTLRIGLIRKAKQMLSRSEAGLVARVSGTGVEGRQVRLKQA
ncbi:MAG TPA: hypothetical protein VFW48_06545 [Solirubrobacterales bacterium]|nr:hypothetical protein [Solirubrobacterales bacterium]